MTELPSLGTQPKKTPWALIACVALAAGLAAGGAYFFLRRPPEESASPPRTPSSMAAPSPAAASDAGVAPAAAAPAPKDPLAEAGLRRVAITVDGPLESSLLAQLGRPLGAPLTQVVTRLLVWWVSVPADLRKGDQLSALFEERAGEEPLLHALRFHSGKHGKTFQAFRFKPKEEPFARFFLPTGEELEERLVDGPLDAYEQVTSLLRDGRRHKGVDFKAPLGSPVKATFDGVVARKNWAFRRNGNCLEVAESGGARRKALFLHLSEVPRSLKVGQRVSTGEVIAASGNTGRSFAPHLHYQLVGSSGRVLDPFDEHRTFRRALAASEKASFEAEVRRLTALLSPVLDPPPHGG
ncbi:MAG: M23 family metallopeptidase [Myxococcales bacterium]|nr:M23 family metallopeptidase [Myxococcales bacterium]